MSIEQPSPTTIPGAPPPRLHSVDTYRGAVMLLMMAEVLELRKVADAFPGNTAWAWLAYHQSHVEWRGCSVHDLIQPSFSFLVGVSLPFSLASRLARGASARSATLHAAWRALVLIALGIILRSIGRTATNYTFEDTLTQIGLGYLPLFLIGMARPRARWIALGLILLGYWAAFIVYPTPAADFAYKDFGVEAAWPHHLEGLGSHWNKNSNLASSFDRWFLNRFPRETPFEFNRGGYATLSFIPTLATMILGLIAGDRLRGQGGARSKLSHLALAAILGISAGLLLDRLGVCPIVKRIWTPSWVLFSGGICFAVLGLLFVLVDLTGRAAWTYPLRVIGRNSIAAYCLAHLAEDFLRSSFRTHIGLGAFEVLGKGYAPLLEGLALLAGYWLVLCWMDRRKIYLRV